MFIGLSTLPGLLHPQKVIFVLQAALLSLRAEQEPVGNMSRKEMWLISMDKGKPDSSVLLTLCLLHWLPHKSSLSFESLKTLHRQQTLIKLFAIKIIFTSPCIYTHINTHKETFQQEPFIPLPSGSVTLHMHPLSSKRLTGLTQPLPDSLVVHSVNLKLSGIPRTWTLRQMAVFQIPSLARPRFIAWICFVRL